MKLFFHGEADTFVEPQELNVVGRLDSLGLHNGL